MVYEKFIPQKCDHSKFERIGVTKDRIYSETEERCVKCGLVREIGSEAKKQLEDNGGEIKC